jgi:proton-dependent oligopeptide transporter, POT family
MFGNQHPKGLPYLFFTEMWERFGYYLMIGIFVLYLSGEKTKGGLGFERAYSADVYGTFIALVYVTPFVGGLLADRWLGYRFSITLGGILMGLGYLGLSVQGEWAFYLSLLLIVVGNGFFKPNISTLLGNLYTEAPYKDKKDVGYNIFYMGINVGAFICNFFAAFLRHNFGWGAAFAGAGVGMFIGVIAFWIGMKHYAHADVRKAPRPEDPSIRYILSTTLVPALIAGVLGYLIPGNWLGSDTTDAFVLGALPIVFFYINMYRTASTEEKRPLGALMTIFAIVIVFWAVFKQNGTALTTWAESYTDRAMPSTIQTMADGLHISEKMTFKKDSVFALDAQFRKLKDANGKPFKEYNYKPYFKNMTTDQLPAEGSTISLTSTELFQSINPFFIILFTPLVVAFFAFLARRGKEPTTPTKIALGLVVSALSTLVMVAAVYWCSNGAVKSSHWWLIGCYGMVTIGELFLSPMGLSLVSKLSPPRYTAVLMGGWLLAISLGNKLSGVLATLWDGYENKANFFLINCLLLTIASVVMFLLLKRLNKIFEEYVK